MKELELTKGKVAIVDDSDFEWLSKWKWHFTGRDARRSVYFGGGRKNAKYKYYLLGREIMKCPEGMEVDHINGNPLDNRKSNLRLATRKQNGANRKINKNNTSGFKGVIFDSKATTHKKWKAQINTEGKLKNLGRFMTKEEAAIVYNQAAKKYFGEFANLNYLRG